MQTGVSKVAPRRGDAPRLACTCPDPPAVRGAAPPHWGVGAAQDSEAAHRIDLRDSLRVRTAITRVSPWRLGGLSARELAGRVARIAADEILDRAAALSYYFLFAIFPALLFMTTLIGLLPVPELMERLLAYGDRILPSDAMSVLRTILDQVVRGARESLLSVSAAGALWGASRAIRSIITALNVVYDVTTPRPWWRRQVVSMILTVTFSLFTLAALLLVVFGERIGRVLVERAGRGELFAATWSVVHWVAIAVCVLTALDLVYHLGPAVRPRWHWLTPGSAFALATWLLTSLGLRLYVTHLGDYNATYGSIGGVILLVLWLYLGGVALLVGAEINAVIAGAEAPRRAAGAPGPRRAP